MKKVTSIIGKIISALIVLFTVFVMIFTVISVNTVGKEQGIFGYRPYIVLSNSMSGVFDVGDIVVSKETDTSKLKVGDIISFKSIDPNNYDTIVTHKIKEITTYEGKTAFVTYGVNTGIDDTYPVPQDRVIGVYQLRLPKLGYFFQFLKTPLGYFVLIFIPFMILIFMEGRRFFKLFKQYRLEQVSELEQQKAIVESQRAEKQEMKAEIERLKSQLAQQNDEGKTKQTE